MEERRLVTRGVIIKKAREAAGLTKSELARKLGIKLSGISTYENGEAKVVFPKTVDKLSKVINVDTLYNPVFVRRLRTRDKIIDFIERNSKYFPEETVIDYLAEEIQEVEVLYYEH